MPCQSLRDSARPGCWYRHCNGVLFRVARLERDPETGGTLVVYRAGEGPYYTVPLWRWSASVEWEGRRVPAFLRVAGPVK